MKVKFTRNHFDFVEGEVYEFENCNAQVEYFLSMGLVEVVEEQQADVLEDPKQAEDEVLEEQ